MAKTKLFSVDFQFSPSQPDINKIEYIASLIIIVINES